MGNKITDFLRNQVLILSSIITIISVILTFMGIIWFGLRDYLLAGDLPLGVYSNTIKNLEDWNFYILSLGLFLMLVGVWYLYSYHKNKKFLLDELETNKRSEFIKNRYKLEATARHLPSKYGGILKKKMKELKIK